MMKYLLDTNVVLWLSEDKPRIEQLKPLLISMESQVFISTVTWWELTIKRRAGKINVDVDELQSFAENHNFIELPVTGKYMKTYLELPSLHKDPFDHMLLAQAIATPMRLVTGDSLLAQYSSVVMVI